MKRREESEDTEKKGEIRGNEARAPINQNYIFPLLFSSPLFSLHFTRAFLYLNEQILNSARSL